MVIYLVEAVGQWKSIIYDPILFSSCFCLFIFLHSLLLHDFLELVNIVEDFPTRVWMSNLDLLCLFFFLLGFCSLLMGSFSLGFWFSFISRLLSAVLLLFFQCSFCFEYGEVAFVVFVSWMGSRNGHFQERRSGGSARSSGDWGKRSGGLLNGESLLCEISALKVMVGGGFAIESMYTLDDCHIVVQRLT